MFWNTKSHAMLKRLSNKVMLSIVITGLTSLNSCESSISFDGNVYDKTNYEPVQDVSILLVLKGDTIKNNYFNNGEYQPATSDSLGYFKVGDVLVSCIPNCPSGDLIFVKKGYDSLTYKSKVPFKDGLRIYLQKIK